LIMGLLVVDPFWFSCSLLCCMWNGHHVQHPLKFQSELTGFLSWELCALQIGIQFGRICFI
jgi:hypothetical protein